MRLLAAVLLVLACHRAPEEPAPHPVLLPAVEATPAASPPPLALQVRRVEEALADGGVPLAAAESNRPALPLPPGIDVVALRVGRQWTIAAVESDRVSSGIPGAERVLARWREDGRTLSAPELALLLGTFAYYPYPIFVTRGAVPITGGSGGAGVAYSAAASLVNRPGGTGQSLTFGYLIPDGHPGAGLHVAHFTITQGGLIIDEAPHPEAR